MTNKKEKDDVLDDKNVEESISENVEINEPLEEENIENKEAMVLEKLMEENAKLKDDYLRAFSEVENTKRRCQQEIDKNNKFAVANFAKELLGVADNLQRAIDAASKEENNPACESLLKGVELTQQELTKVFDKFHIHKMEIMGSIFDPNFHQVIQEVADASKPAGTIIAEIQTGYMISDRILREAMVVVTKA